MKLALPKLKVFSSKGIPFLKSQKPKTSLAVQITERSLRILELDDKLQPTFEPVFHPWKGTKFEEKQIILKSYVEKYNLKGRDVVSVLGVNDGFLQYTKYPSTLSQSDLLNAIEWTIKRKQAEIGEEMYYDYYILKEKDDNKNVWVVMVFAREEVVNNLQRLIEGAGLNLKVLDYEVNTLINFGILGNLPKPFSMLYIDYDYIVLVNYSGTFLSYSSMHTDLDFHTKDIDFLENFLVEVRNNLVVGDISNVYLTGPILEEAELLNMIMESLPIIGLLEPPNLKPRFLIPYILCRRGLEK